MSRPKKCRNIENHPEINSFRPSTAPVVRVEKSVLRFEELEALRLADHEGKKHEEAATIMNVSRATFGRIIEKARYTVADALLNSKTIVIKGGDFCCIDFSLKIDSPEMQNFIDAKQGKCLKCDKYLAIKASAMLASEISSNN